jgi:large subunit ribosomal protein L25
LIKDVQKHITKDTLSHIDFYQVDMHKEITTEIHLNFIGESKAVKELGGMLIKNYDHIEVKCLPSDLVNHIDIDISILKEFGDHISLHDLSLPTGLKLVHETNDMVVSVMEPKVQEEEPAPVAEATAPAADAAKGVDAAKAGEKKSEEKK